MKKKLNLEELKISSFRTSLDDAHAQTIKGGSIYCTEPTDPDPCGSHGCGTRYRSCGGGCGSNNCGSNNCGQSMDISGPCAC